METSIHSKLLSDAEEISRKITELQTQYAALKEAAKYYKTPIPVVQNTTIVQEQEQVFKGKGSQVLRYLMDNGDGSLSAIMEKFSIPKGSMGRMIRELVGANAIKKTGRGEYAPTKEAFERWGHK